MWVLHGENIREPVREVGYDQRDSRPTSVTWSRSHGPATTAVQAFNTSSNRSWAYSTRGRKGDGKEGGVKRGRYAMHGRYLAHRVIP